MEGLDRSATVEDAVVVAGKATDLKRRGSYQDAEGAKTLRPTFILQRTLQTLVFQGQKHMVLKGYSLYILTIRAYIRHLDLSGEVGFKDVSVNHKFPMCRPALSAERFKGGKLISYSNNIVVATSGEVLFVHTEARELTFERHRMFHVYKRDPKDLDPNTYDTELVEVYTLGDEALFLDLGITVPADRTLGIEPNSIYFTRDDRIRHKKHSCLDICVYNLATKTTKRFPSLSSLNLKDAQWFIPS